MRRPLCLLFLSLLAVLSFYIGVFSPEVIDPFLYLNGSEQTLTGTLTRKEMRVSFDGEQVTDLYLQPHGQQWEVCVQLGTADKETVNAPEIGQEISACGQVKCFLRATNPGVFDMYAYKSLQGIAFTLKDARLVSVSGRGNLYRELLYRLGVRFRHALTSSMDEKDAGIMRAMLLGERAGLDEDTQELYRRSGIMHILAVSGLHISVLGMGLYRLLRSLRIPVKAATPICVVMMYSYGVMCGMSTSAFRAVIMFSLMLTAPLLGRSYDMLSAMSLCGLMVLAENPRYAVHSGFLMSFGAVCALGMMLPLLQEIFSFAPRLLQKYLLPCLSVSLTALPVYMCFYFTVPLASLVLNPLILPLTGILIPAGILSILGGLLCPPAGLLFGEICHLILWFYESLCRAFLSFETTLYTGVPSLLQVILFYLLLVLAVGIKERADITGLKRRLIPALLLALSIPVIVFRWRGGFSVTFLDVGQGDCIIMRGADFCYLVDGGSSSVSAVGRYRIVPYLQHEGIGRIQAVFVSHEDEDHISGIRELLEETERGGIRVEQLILPDVGAGARGEAYPELEQKAATLKIPLTYLRAGDYWEEEGIRFTCPAPRAGMAQETNAGSMVLHVRAPEMEILLTGDVEGEGLRLVKAYLEQQKADERLIRVLKVAHHGSANNTDRELLELFPPEVAVISCGRNNRYGHPHDETLTLLKETGARICTTYETGAVTLYSDGQTVRLASFTGF